MAFTQNYLYALLTHHKAQHQKKLNNSAFLLRDVIKVPHPNPNHLEETHHFSSIAEDDGLSF